MDSETLYNTIKDNKDKSLNPLIITIEAPEDVLDNILDNYNDLFILNKKDYKSIQITPKTHYFAIYTHINELLYIGSIKNNELITLTFNDIKGLLNGRVVYDLYAITADIHLKEDNSDYMSSLLYQIADNSDDFDQLGFQIGR